MWGFDIIPMIPKFQVVVNLAEARCPLRIAGGPPQTGLCDSVNRFLFLFAIPDRLRVQLPYGNSRLATKAISEKG